MIKLISNELYKILHRKSTLILLGIWLLTIGFNIYRNEAAGFVKYASDFTFVNLMLTIVGATILSEEFAKRTIKFLLTMSYKREEILFSKLAAVVIFGISINVLQIMLYFVGFMFKDAGTMLQVSAFDGMFPLVFINGYVQFLYITLALFISLFTRSQGLAITINVITLFLGQLINALIGATTDNPILSWIIEHNPLSMFNIVIWTGDPETIMLFNLLPFYEYVIGILFYCALFYGLTNYFFSKKDIILD